MSCMGSTKSDQGGLYLEDTELRLGLPGTDASDKDFLSGFRGSKRASEGDDSDAGHDDLHAGPAANAQVVGWPPIRSYRKNSFKQKKSDHHQHGVYVKVSMDGAPYLRKIDLSIYKGYHELLNSLENMFKFRIGEYSEREGYGGSEFVPAYEDKEGDLMLVGDVPWEMFASTCKRLRIIRASDAKGLGYAI
ncbi:Auxin-responsive protein IAA4-like protein [Drosera capensis]